MSSLFLRLLNHSLQASALILAVMLLRLLFRKLPKSPQCLLWAVVALRLALPFSLESAWSLLPAAEPIPAEAAFSTPVPETPVETTLALEAVPKDIQPEAPIRVQPATDPLKIASYVWAAGVAVMMAMGLFSYLHLKRALRVSIRLTKNIYLCDSIPGPFVLGLVHPKIYLPSGLDEFSRSLVLAHEEAHLKHGDPWWKLVGYVLLCIYWFQPMVWVGWWLFCRDLEMGCDERAVAGMTPMQKKTYACTLLRCAAPKGLQYLCPVAFGQNSVKSRIKNVLTDKKTKLWLLGGAAVVALIVCSLFLTTQKSAKNGAPVSIALPEGYTLYQEEPWKLDLMDDQMNLIGGVQGTLLSGSSSVPPQAIFDMLGMNMSTSEWVGGGTEWTIRENGGEECYHSLVSLSDRVFDIWFKTDFAPQNDGAYASIKGSIQTYLQNNPDILDLTARPIAQRISAQGAAVYDLSTGETLFAKNETLQIWPGRWNRVAFVAAILEQAPDLDSTLSIIGLQNADNYRFFTVRDHLYNFLFQPYDTFSPQVLTHCLSTRGDEEALALTNQWLRAAGCTDTYFDSASECSSMQAHTTVQDIGRILTTALKNDTFREIWSTAVYDLPYRDIPLYNNNFLLPGSPLKPEAADSRVTGGLAYMTGYADLACTVGQNDRYLCIIQNADRVYDADGWTVRYWGNIEEAKLVLDGVLERTPQAAID